MSVSILYNSESYILLTGIRKTNPREKVRCFLNQTAYEEDVSLITT